MTIQRTRVRRLGALLFGVALVCGACSDDGDTVDTAPAPTSTAVVSTAAATTTPPAMPPGSLTGLKGTRPLVRLSVDFKHRLDATPTGLADLDGEYVFAAETYDAFIIIALAAEMAATDGSALADEIVGITKDGRRCTTFAACRSIIAGGGDPDYDGAAGPSTMNGNGELLATTYALLTFGADGRIDESLTEVRDAAAPPSAQRPLARAAVERAGDGVLRFGSILPLTGSLAFLGPPMSAGAELAIEEINTAGGVLDQPVEYLPGDSGDTGTDTAVRTVEGMLDDDVDAIIGAASSSVSLAVIDTITAAGVIQFSPAISSMTLIDYPDQGLFFRNAPQDDLQGLVLGQAIVDDGVKSVYILAVDDIYGTSLAGVLDGVVRAGGVEVLGTRFYGRNATGFDADVGDIVAADPDAVVVISLGEGGRVIQTMVDHGVGPASKRLYGTDGTMSSVLGELAVVGK